MSVWEEEEERLRERLDSCLGEITPGPIPMEAITGAGRRIRRRHAWAVAGTGGLVAVAVASGLFVFLPADTGTHAANGGAARSVEVNSLSHDQAAGLIGSGTVGSIPWHVGIDPASGGTYMESIGGRSASASGLVIELSSDLNGPLGSLIVSSQGPYPNLDGSFYVGYGIVPNTVGKLVFDYPNGESVTVPVVPWHNKPFVAYAGTSNLPVSRVTAYDTAGREMGYSIPFNGWSEPMMVSWYTPGQVPTEPTATKTISGTSGSTHWSITLDTGPFGTCVTENVPPLVSGSGKCQPPGVPAANAIGDTVEYTGGATLPPIVRGVVDSKVAQVKAVLTNGTTVLLPLSEVGGLKMVASVLPLGTTIKTIASYDSAGKMLAQQQE
jgi:hypothetical protein